MSFSSCIRRSRTICSICILLAAVFLVWWHLLPSGREFATLNPTTTALVETRVAEAHAEGRDLEVHLSFIPLRSISPALIKTVVVAEDGNFWSHKGFDYAELWKALKEAWRSRTVPRGASTISQQLAKNLYLSESKNPARKLLEAFITFRIEHTLSKDRILELYLNVIEWGYGIFGAEAAAQHYFRTHAANLSMDQASFLAAIIPGPTSAFDPRKNARKVSQRQRLLRDRAVRRN